MRCESLALGLWLGSILFFSAVTAPTAFRSLDSQNAGTYIRAIFPSYYLFGIVCGVIAAVLLLVAVIVSPSPSTYASAVLVGVMLVTSVYARQGLLPRVDSYREARAQAGESDPAAYAQADAGFKRAHRLSVMLNSAVFLMGIAAFLVRRVETLRPPGGGPH